MKVLETAFRVYCRHEELEVQIAFYERLQGTTCARRTRISETGVTAAKVGSVLVLAGDEAVLGPVCNVTAIFWVEALDELLAWLAAQGASLVNGPSTVVGGRNATVRHPDGLVVEYFEAASSVVQKGR